jgi:hypothetical protein
MDNAAVAEDRHSTKWTNSCRFGDARSPSLGITFPGILENPSTPAWTMPQPLVSLPVGNPLRQQP